MNKINLKTILISFFFINSLAYGQYEIKQTPSYIRLIGPTDTTQIESDRVWIGMGSSDALTIFPNAIQRGGNRHIYLGNSNDIAISARYPLARLHVADEQNRDVSLISHGIVLIGETDGRNLAMDDNEIMARDNGGTSPLFINDAGGRVTSGGVIQTRQYFIADDMNAIGDYENVQWNSSTGEIGYDNSSIRYKNNVSDFTDDWEKILKLRPVKYTRGESSKRWEYGYIAEEVDELDLKSMVSYDEEGLPHNVNYEKLILYLTEMIKSQQEEIAIHKIKYENQQTQIDAILEELQKLKSH